MQRIHELKYQLSFEKTRDDAVRTIVAAFQECGTLAKAAAKLDVHRRTLHRWTLDIPQLKAALEAARSAAKADEPADAF